MIIPEELRPYRPLPGQGESKILEDPTQEIIQDALKTLPVQPYAFRLRFVANGIERYRNGLQEVEYQAECARHGVIPCVTSYFFIGENGNISSTIDVQHESGDNRSIPKDLAARIRTNLIAGGRPHGMEVQGRQNIEVFNQKLLPQLQEHGYQFSEGRLLFTSDCYSRASTVLEFRVAGGKTGLHLRTGLHEQSPEKFRLEQWFDDFINNQPK